MQLSNWVGYAAGTLTTLSFLPQVIKTWQSRSAKDISLSMFLMFCTGVTLWIIYGVLHRDLPVIIANVVTLALASIILGFKLRYPT
jgi:MtN3 and saliva related transmembrane protein